MFTKLKQYKDMRAQAKKIQGALEGEKISTDAAGGRVRVQISGNMEIGAITIDPSLLATGEKTRLEDALKDAVNAGLKKTQQIMAKKVKEMGGIPGMPS